MEETTETFDFSAVTAPAPSSVPVVVEEEKLAVPEPVPTPVIVEEEKVVVPAPEPVPAPPVVEEEKVPVVFPAPVFVQEEKRVVSAPAASRPIILPGVPSPTKPFKLRFGLRNNF